MRKLILIKHAPPLVNPAVLSEQWPLSEKGRGLCVPLADAIAAHAPSMIVSSKEPKAAETAQLVAERLRIPWQTAPDLYEHDRSNVPHMRSGEFISMMEVFFRKPDDLVLGQETANEARARFDAAVNDILAEHAEGNIAIVSHGTVIALMLENLSGRPPFQTWRAMGLPSFVVMSMPNLRVCEEIDRIG